jgi:hypothetical protein
MVDRNNLGNVLAPGEQLNKVVQYVLRPQNNTGNNPLCTLIRDESIQFALYSIPVMCEDISSEMVYQPIHSAGTEMFATGEQDGLHVGMI